jgi:Universal stress protein family
VNGPIVSVVSIDGLRPVYLIATDGSESSAGAVRLGMLAAERSRGTAELVTVGDRTAGPRVRNLVDRLSTASHTWSHAHFPGSLASGLAQAAAERHATIVLMGTAIDSGGANTAEVAALLSVPVVAVPGHVRTLPRRALLAIDFGRASVSAAGAALHLLARPAHALMLSVSASADSDDRDSPVDILFNAVQDALGRPRDVALERHHASGDTVDTILRLAATHEADLISVGQWGRWSQATPRTRAIGHVARAVFKSATCSVIGAPIPSS